MQLDLPLRLGWSGGSCALYDCLSMCGSISTKLSHVAIPGALTIVAGPQQVNFWKKRLVLASDATKRHFCHGKDSKQ
eukprot:516410-Amphidinium_carterae.1